MAARALRIGAAARVARLAAVWMAVAPIGACLAAPRRLPASPQIASAGVTQPYQLVAGRIIVTLSFTRADGRERKALAWLNMGTPKMALAPELARELGAVSGRPLVVRLGTMPIDVAPGVVDVGTPELDGEDILTHLFAPEPVEAILPARVLQRFEFVLDLPARRITLAPPGTIPPQGVATPLLVDPDTGLATLETTIAGERHRLALDAGASFTWLRGTLVRRWLETNPTWRRAEGAVGASNMGLTSLAFERDGVLARLPEIAVAQGPTLPDVEILGTAPLICSLCDQLTSDLFWDGWQANAPAPVAGWLGIDPLEDFKLTVDYANRTLYWLRQQRAAPRSIDEVGVTLVRRRGAYTIGGVVAKAGAPPLTGVEPGDRLLAVDGVATTGRSSDDVWRALGGSVGTRHVLSLDRRGETVEVVAPVSGF